MNLRYGSPARDEAEIERLFALAGWHPYLVRRCLQEMRLHGLGMAEVESKRGARRQPLSKTTWGGCGWHCGAIRRWRRRFGRTCRWEDAQPGTLLRLRAAGVMRGDSPREMRPRCRLYDLTLRRVFA